MILQIMGVLGLFIIQPIRGLFLSGSEARHPLIRKPLTMALYDSSEAARAQIGQSELLLVAPIDAIRMDEVKWIRSNLPQNTKTSVLSRAALIQGIDGTPFVQVAEGIVGSSFCIFVGERDAEKATSAFSKWTRNLASRISEELESSEQLTVLQMSFYMAKKDGTCVRIVIPSFDPEVPVEEGLQRV